MVRLSSATDVDVCTVRVAVQTQQSALQAEAPSVFVLKKLVALVPENSPVGTVVVTPPIVRTEDVVTFRTDSKHFSVDESSGRVRTLVPLDYEGPVKTRHLRIMANDTGRSVMSVQVRDHK